ncbi:uncharacterized protein KLLA0_C09086g [Kluyveromyces lactis]|uniref:KLLA0C09086p n=1 Tax=Kluyveromyces lactis (strain ATCC 8585 / CBS 2359 / DSM 70799 / NBRC 1267 / NRRL Y-1140 / WM37) TaxID=284590 RepID=Q6CTY5_KLULA|nr:uncharacterized protein KLLA0_C09086g [Kluyveromyces lactis]CAH01455.1 KLLA0C09086p [Kluyveromyces lactis]|eukprot:XP_452604.1 uncharacterized protein KLLA0_C09086g [Kluyveromyces lactis]
MSAILAPLAKAIDYVNALNKDFYILSVEEQKELGLWGRVTAYNWTFELACIGLMAILFFISYYGKTLNNKYADKIFGTLNTFLLTKLSFTKVGFSADGKKMPYIEEQNNTWFTSFATGRSTIESVIVKAHLTARHNPLALLTQKALALFLPTLVANDIEEFISVTITPNGQFVSTEDAKLTANSAETLSKLKFITSIVNKAVMTKARDSNYFLSLTHTAENESLPADYVFMSESNKLNGFIPHYAGEDFKVLLSKSAKFLKFISFTDLPEEKPITDKLWESSQLPRCVIYLSLVTSDKDIELLEELITKVVEIYDNVTKDIQTNSSNSFITTDILKKGIQLRKEELGKIVKVMQQVEREMALEKKQEAERQKRKDMRDKLTDQELDKMELKKREKRERRLRNKQKMRI